MILVYITIILYHLDLTNGQNPVPCTKPSWQSQKDRQTIKDEFAKWLLYSEKCCNPLSKILRNACFDSKDQEQIKTATEYEGYDGWYNNPAKPDLGAVDTQLLRRIPAYYEDGTYKPSGSDRPNPFNLSSLLDGPMGSISKVGKNTLLVFFGQQVVEEILDAQRPACPPEYFNIDIPPGHEYRKPNLETGYPGHTQMPVLRTRYDMKTGFSPNNPRQQLNEITPYLDGGLIYGTTKQWADNLRMYANGSLAPHGLLATTEDGLFPERNTIRLPMANPPPPFHHKKMVENHELMKVSRFFKLGNPRGNENPFLLTFGILWFRWHNYIATNLKKFRPDWSDEKIFNEARKWVIASQQAIIVYEWLPSWTGKNLTAYKGYDPSVDPQIDQFFQSVAFRFGHTLVTSGVYLRDYGRNGCNITFPTWDQKAVRTCNHFWRPQDSIENKYSKDSEEVMDIDRLLMGMAYQASEEEDHQIVEDLRGKLFGPLEFSRRDLMALNIQRARDHGLPDFNTAREAYGLEPIMYWSQFTNVEQSTRTKLAEMYGNDISKIDPWIGGIMETDDGPGEFFTTVISDQFNRIRNGDRFWFENSKMFDNQTIGKLKQLRLYDIIMAVTKLEYNDIPQNVFSIPLNESDIHPNCSKKLMTTKCKKDCKSENGNSAPSNRKCSYKTCWCLPPLNETNLDEKCTDPGTYDYFSNSEYSFILSIAFISTFIIGLGGLVLFLLNQESQKRNTKNQRYEQQFRKSSLFLDRIYMPKEMENFFHVSVIEEPNKASKKLTLVLSSPEIQLWNVYSSMNEDVHKEINGDYRPHGVLIRKIDLSKTISLEYHILIENQYLGIRTKNEYDLILRFDSPNSRQLFVKAFETFLNELDDFKRQRVTNISLKTYLKTAVTKRDRQKTLEKFFRVVFAQSFHIQHSEDEILNVDSKTAREAIYTELTLTEFADALSMKPNSQFIKMMFTLIDKDKNGFISFREFLDMLIVFTKGTPEEKAKLMFDIYDINGTGALTRESFISMLTSLMETVNVKVDSMHLEEAVKSMMLKVGIHHKQSISFQDFMLLNDKRLLNLANLDFSKHSNSDSQVMQKAKDAFEAIYVNPEELRARVAGEQVDKDEPILPDSENFVIRKNVTDENYLWHRLSGKISYKSMEYFWLCIFTLFVWGIFAERYYYYSVEREHSGLRQIAGQGVSVTRGAASAMMFCYSAILLTMCRNLITTLRDSMLNQYIPFDFAVDMHKYIACWGLFFTVIHVIGHGFNFYHISTQPSDDLTCLFRNYFHATHEIPKFHYWFWQTITGFTGVILTLITVIIYIFSLEIVRRRLYLKFWLTHSLYPLFYIFLVLHGSGRLIQEPYFIYFFAGPCTIFVLDLAYSLNRKKIEITVLKAELLPSDVLLLEFRKPTGFNFKSGQWVRIACLSHSAAEYHPFTLSSSPHEPNLTVHIRAVGPWTKNLRVLYDESSLIEHGMYPKIYLDGPYGEGHQDWHHFDVSILIGGGIGVTPFASILKDIIHRNSSSSVQKVYFLWVTRTQKQFEWFVDIIRELEDQDKEKLVSVHVFITQFFQKFDLRTILLYMCERHFQRTANKSLFTGLRAVTHFGRPNFKTFFEAFHRLHRKASKIGVFSCGPPPLTLSVDQACIQLNTTNSDGPIFQHHFKNY